MSGIFLKVRCNPTIPLADPTQPNPTQLTNLPSLIAPTSAPETCGKKWYTRRVSFEICGHRVLSGPLNWNSGSEFHRNLYLWLERGQGRRLGHLTTMFRILRGCAGSKDSWNLLFFLECLLGFSCVH